MPVITDIADAVRDEMIGQSFLAGVTPAKFFLPLFELKDMETLHVSVVPKAWDESARSRNSTYVDYGIDVAVQKKVDPTDWDTVKAMMTLVEEIGDFFKLRRLRDYPAAHWISTANDPIYSPEHLNEMKLFTSVLTLTFRAAR